ncbi:MAG TPA: prepilin-type N-terminal cleavage/methylation domain-containing protein [Verrucomicrobiae bacterium]|jgi:prepilin-type N-terminal cleavage/methylation domain-containing protein/prepilin-type processing-associated H-X9-DG protein|nr:prepilin-type N-terminal cleavage/methylation domain-containing protein [Verrucomicrobiae bacterium]
MDTAGANHSRTREKRAFTLTELLVVLVVLAIFAALSIQAMTKSKAKTIQCLNNHRQLMSAALIYADEFSGIWIPNEPEGTGGQTDWVSLDLDWNAGRSDNTNYSKLTNPQYSLLAPYLGGSYSIFHCPSDQSFVTQEGPRVRSVSANQAVGSVWVTTECCISNGPVNGQWLTGANIGGGCQTVWRCYGKTTDFVAPGPSLTFVFADEHPNSINDSQLAFQCAQQGIGAPFIDRPANYHNAAGTFSFADGHVEIHKWVGPSLGTGPDFWTGPNYSLNVTSQADNQDLMWIQQRTSAHK